MLLKLVVVVANIACWVDYTYWSVFDKHSALIFILHDKTLGRG